MWVIESLKDRLCPWLCKNSRISKTRRTDVSGQSGSAPLRNCHCSKCDPKRDLFYRISTPRTFCTAKTQFGPYRFRPSMVASSDLGSPNREGGLCFESYIPVSPSRCRGPLIASEAGARVSEKIKGSISLYSAHVRGLRGSRPSSGVPGDSVCLSRGICLVAVSVDTLLGCCGVAHKLFHLSRLLFGRARRQFSPFGSRIDLGGKDSSNS